ncbi:Uncharacterised protein [Mycobacteroides abscessus subsp. abscessus]|nr:Uncharacterised protein [Mycobacteroides abscessus subsp. abscessus]
MVDGKGAAEHRGGEQERELLADFAIGERDHVAGIGVDTDQTRDFDVKPGFLFDFPHGGVGDSFADVVAAAR